MKYSIAMVNDPISDIVNGNVISTIRFAKILRKRGHRIIFIAAKSPKNPHNNEYQGFKVYRSSSILLPKSEGQFHISLPTIKKIKKILKDEHIDIVHLFDPTPSAYAALKAAHSLKKKVIMHSHTQPENIFLHFPKIIASGGINKIFYRYLYWLYKKADAIIYPSELAYKLFNPINNEVANKIISNGIDCARFQSTQTKNFIAKFKLNKKNKNILYVGRLHPEKDVPTLIKSFVYILKQRPDINLWIVGFGHLENKLKKLAKNLNLEKNIFFIGRVSDEDLISAYQACDIFALPSLAELEGMVVLEAMACGKPIIIANAPNSASAYFVKDNGLLFKAEDAKDFAKQALRILNNDNLRKAMGEASLKMSKQYDIAKSVNQIENVYQAVINN